MKPARSPGSPLPPLPASARRAALPSAHDQVAPASEEEARDQAFVVWFLVHSLATTNYQGALPLLEDRRMPLAALRSSDSTHTWFGAPDESGAFDNVGVLWTRMRDAEMLARVPRFLLRALPTPLFSERHMVPFLASAPLRALLDLPHVAPGAILAFEWEMLESVMANRRNSMPEAQVIETVRAMLNVGVDQAKYVADVALRMTRLLYTRPVEDARANDIAVYQQAAHNAHLAGDVKAQIVAHKAATITEGSAKQTVAAQGFSINDVLSTLRQLDRPNPLTLTAPDPTPSTDEDDE